VPVGLGGGILKISKLRAGSLFRGGNLLFSMPAEFAVKFRLYSLFEETSLQMNEDGLAKSQKSCRSRAGESPELLDLTGFPLSRE
jgi:hypothetical protein